MRLESRRFIQLSAIIIVEKLVLTQYLYYEWLMASIPGTLLLLCYAIIIVFDGLNAYSHEP